MVDPLAGYFFHFLVSVSVPVFILLLLEDGKCSGWPSTIKILDKLPENSNWGPEMDPLCDGFALLGFQLLRGFNRWVFV